MAKLYCECGHWVWSELWWEESGYALLFFDDVETSETYTERVTSCPGCSRRLRLGVLGPSAEHSSGAQVRRHETV